jgi:hypothetical protein
MSRQLDAAIAEALGYEVNADPFVDGLIYAVKEKIDYLPHYSTDGNAMLELDSEMRKRGWDLELQIIGEYYGADYYHLEDEIGGDIQQADTEPLARALAAHKALTGEEWEGE